jgi:hypothetical protein
MAQRLIKHRDNFTLLQLCFFYTTWVVFIFTIFKRRFLHHPVTVDQKRRANLRLAHDEPRRHYSISAGSFYMG